jgi:Rrf2 family protein
MLTLTAEYALRALVWLADHPQEPQTAEAMGRGTRVPVGYLAKIMQQIVRSGIATSQRGQRGGFTLARPPADLSILDVVRAVEPTRSEPPCPVDHERHGDQLCKLHRRLHEIEQQAISAYRLTTLADLLVAKSDGAEASLCPMPRRVEG